MNWLRGYAWLTGWLALPIAIANMVMRLKQKPSTGVDFTWAIIYLTFGVALGITLTPTFDEKSRSFTQWLAMLSFFCIIFSRNRDN